MVYCRYCGEKMDESSIYCIHCGKPQKNEQLTSMRSPFKKKGEGLAAALSFLIVGLEHIYLGKILRGIGLLCFTLIIGLILVALFPLTLIFGLIMGILAAYDAYNLARRYNYLLDKNGEPPW